MSSHGATGQPAAIIMNMSYTGLGIARDLGQCGIPVIGLQSEAAGIGLVSKYGPVLQCPDSAGDGERLTQFFGRLTKEVPRGSVIFPTRDADLFFLDSVRSELTGHYVLAVPPSDVLTNVLDKAQLAEESRGAGVPTPNTVAVEAEGELRARAAEIGFPLVLKPVFARDWRRPGVWEGVGRAKAIRVHSFDELVCHYRRISIFNPRMLLQEWISGEDDGLFVCGVYFDRRGRCLGSFVARKRLQYPSEFGTGCLVVSADEPEVERLTMRLLKALRFSGLPRSSSSMTSLRSATS